MGFVETGHTKGESNNDNNNIHYVAEVKFEVEEVKNHYEPYIPSFQGDYAKTIFLWKHEKTHTVCDNDNYTRYFIYECGIKNPRQYHIDLINDGYFQEATYKEVLNTFSAKNLKEILEHENQPKTGKKELLINRIIENIDEDVIKSYITEPYYIISKKGYDFVQTHYDYVLLHKYKRFNIDWREYDKKKMPGYSFYDTVWGILNERVMEDKRNFGRNQYMFMYEICRDQGKRDRALELILTVLYIDLSGSCEINAYNLYTNCDFRTKEDMFKYYDIACMCAPGTIKLIEEFYDIYDDKIVDELYKWKLPVQICSKEDFLLIVHSVFDFTCTEQKVKDILYPKYCNFIESLK